MERVFKVYAIKSINRNYIYVGQTSNIEDRLKRHNKGYEKTTRAYKPFRLIYTENCETRTIAREREKYFKSGVGKEFLKKVEIYCPDGGIGRHARFRV